MRRDAWSIWRGASTRYAHRPLSMCTEGRKEKERKINWSVLSDNRRATMKDIVNVTVIDSYASPM